MKSLYSLILVVSACFTGANLSAQCSTTPCTTVEPAFDPADACILPGPDALDCYMGATFNSPPFDIPPSIWCGSIQNNQWFAFTATSTSVSIDISVGQCQVGSLLQAALFSTPDCVNFSPVSNCLNMINSGTTATIQSNILVPGQNYYLMIDGGIGAECDFAFNMPILQITGPTDGFCLNQLVQGTYTSNQIVSWTIEPPTAGVILGSSTGQTVHVEWLQAGEAQLCAQLAECPNSPLTCISVEVGYAPDSTSVVDLCPGRTVDCGDQTFFMPGNYTVSVPGTSGCTGVLHCVVHLLPSIPPITEHVDICPGQKVNCAGSLFSQPGIYPVHLESYQGCDSLVNCYVHLMSPPVSPLTQVEICGPGQYTVCNTVHIMSGIYTDTCFAGSWLGCDSLVKTDLAILQPSASIDPPGILHCDSSALLTLYGNHSTVSGASGSDTFNHWTGPGIVGANDRDSVRVNLPGAYCLEVSQERNGHACKDTACVTVVCCSTSAGTMDTALLTVCGLQGVAPVDHADRMLSADDSLVYILYSDSLHPLNSIIATSDSLYFPFLPDSLHFDTTYFIAALVAPRLPNDSLDLLAPCLDLSPPQGVRWHAHPTVSLVAAPQAVCKADCLMQTFQFMGRPPFHFSWEVRQNGQSLLTRNEAVMGSEKTIQVCPAEFIPAVTGEVEFRVLQFGDKWCTCVYQP